MRLAQIVLRFELLAEFITGRYPVVPRTRGSFRRSAIFNRGGYVVRWLHLRGDVHSKTIISGRLGNRRDFQDISVCYDLCWRHEKTMLMMTDCSVHRTTLFGPGSPRSQTLRLHFPNGPAICRGLWCLVWIVMGSIFSTIYSCTTPLVGFLQSNLVTIHILSSEAAHIREEQSMGIIEANGGRIDLKVLFRAGMRKGMNRHGRL